MTEKKRRLDATEPPPKNEDDFVSVARRLGADESKERFEAKLKKIAKAEVKDRK